MRITSQKLWYIGIAGAGLVVIGALSYRAYEVLSPRPARPGPAPTSQETDEEPRGKAPMDAGEADRKTKLKTNAEGSVSFEFGDVPLSLDGSLALPDLNRPITFPANFQQEARKIVAVKIERLSAELKQDPRTKANWLNLAIQRKTIEDYEGAREIWEFLTAADPRDHIPFANLASLFALYLKNPGKAEQNFTLALQKNPTDVSVYRNAYEFYRYVRKDDHRAKAILRQGIEKNPGSSQDLQYLLDHYAEQ